MKEIACSLRELDRRAAEHTCCSLDVQLVAQVCAAPTYAAWKADIERAWRKTGRWTTAAWPTTLDADAFGAALLPLPAGRVGLAAGKYARPIASPLFTIGSPPNGRYEDMVLGLVARWAGNLAEGLSARLAPPVIEVVQRGRVIDRRLADFGIAWPLPAPDGL